MTGLTKAIKDRYESDATLAASDASTLWYGWPKDRNSWPYAKFRELPSGLPQFSLATGSRIIKAIYQITIFHFDETVLKSLHDACFARFKDWAAGAITGGTHLATQETQESYIADTSSAMPNGDGQLIYQSVHTFRFFCDRA